MRPHVARSVCYCPPVTLVFGLMNATGGIFLMGFIFQMQSLSQDVFMIIDKLLSYISLKII